MRGRMAVHECVMWAFILLAPQALGADCNLNGVEDRDEVLTGRAFDCDEDGILDECEDPAVSFRVTFEAPAEQLVPRGGKRQVSAEVLLHTQGIPPGEPGAEGWALFVTSSSPLSFLFPRMSQDKSWRHKVPHTSEARRRR